MASPHQFRLTPSPGISTAAPLTLTQELATALQGGQAIYDFFSGDGQALQNLYQKRQAKETGGSLRAIGGFAPRSVAPPSRAGLNDHPTLLIPG